MASFLKRLATRMDTAGAKTRQRGFREGWPSRTSTEIKFFKSPKVQYRYRERGEGKTLVFSADPPCTLEVYDELLEVFANNFRVIVVELPAMGFSAADADYRFGWQETNDDLACFLRDVARKDAVLAFSCVAGLAAVDIAVRYPELASHLILIQTGDVEAFARWKKRRDPRRILAKPFFGQYMMKRLAPKRMGAWFDLVVGRRERISAFCSCARESFEHGALWSLASAYQNYLDPTVGLGRAKQPALALWGEADGSHPAENAERSKLLAEHVHYVALPEIGHFPELEAPVEMRSRIEAFLTEHPPHQATR